MKDASKKKVLHDFLTWAVTKGQAYAGDLGYAPLPKELSQRELKDIGRLK
jgi:ABC-type phosphate transport system substrate-binding protein